MALSDVIGDMLTRIRNAMMVGHAECSTPASRFREGVLKVLESEGYINGFETVEYEKGKKHIVIKLKYKDGVPVIEYVKRVSKPGRRVYSKIGDLPKVANGLGISILSTSKGIMSDNEASKLNVGGEVLCQVF